MFLPTTITYAKVEERPQTALQAPLSPIQYRGKTAEEERLEEEINRKESPHQREVREAITDYFEDDSDMMIRIAICESQLRQFDKNGSVLRGIVDPEDTGVFQISKRYWNKEAKKLGIDFSTLEGNIEMADYILHTSGIAAWKASAPCHGYW